MDREITAPRAILAPLAAVPRYEPVTIATITMNTPRNSAH